LSQRPKPTALKLVEGNPGKRPIHADEPRPPLARPKAPGWLSAEAKREWRRVVNLLADVGMMTELDVGLLGAYCDAYGTWVRARKALERVARADETTGGLVIRTQKGNFIQNPLINVINTAMQLMKSFACEFGMSPAVRSRLHVDIGNPSTEAPKQDEPTGTDRFFR